jgi:hypothetical protein
MSKKENYDSEGNAEHYNTERLNSAIKMEAIWGTHAMMVFCEINAFKYRERLGKKDGASPAQDLVKAEWYEKAAKFYFKKLQDDEGIEGHSYAIKYNLPWKDDE